MQRRLRITLAIVAATGALALGAGTAAADPLGNILGGDNSNNPTASSSDRGDNSDADSRDNNGNSNGTDGTDGDDGTDWRCGRPGRQRRHQHQHRAQLRKSPPQGRRRLGQRRQLSTPTRADLAPNRTRVSNPREQA